MFERAIKFYLDDVFLMNPNILMLVCQLVTKSAISCRYSCRHPWRSNPIQLFLPLSYPGSCSQGKPLDIVSYFFISVLALLGLIDSWALACHSSEPVFESSHVQTVFLFPLDTKCGKIRTKWKLDTNRTLFLTRISCWMNDSSYAINVQEQVRGTLTKNCLKASSRLSTMSKNSKKFLLCCILRPGAFANRY